MSEQMFNGYFLHEVHLELPVADFDDPLEAMRYAGATRYASYLLSWAVERELEAQQIFEATPEQVNATRAVELLHQSNLLLEYGQPINKRLDVDGALRLDSREISLFGGRMIAYWQPSRKGPYEITSIAGKYPESAGGGHMQGAVPVSMGHYEGQPNLLDIEQNPGLRAALAFSGAIDLLQNAVDDRGHRRRPNYFSVQPIA